MSDPAYWLLVALLLLILWNQRLRRKQLAAVALAAMKAHLRVTDMDNRHSKRLYELTRLFRAMDACVRETRWAVVPLEVSREDNSDMVASIRQSLRKTLSDSRISIDDPGEVLPSYLDPAKPIDPVDYAELARTTLNDLIAAEYHRRAWAKWRQRSAVSP